MILQRILTNPSIRGHSTRPISNLKPTDFISTRSCVLSIPTHQGLDDQNAHSYSSIRSYHVSAVAKKNPATIILSLSAIAATAKAGQYMVRAYDQWKISQPEKPPSPTKEEDEASSSTQQQSAQENIKTKHSKRDNEEEEEEGKRENIFQTLFNLGVGSKFYEGGFEEKMTRREAALILGVRETSTTKRIKEAHRKLLVLNHPDTGGSTFLSGKINEAKELLMKGRREG